SALFCGARAGALAAICSVITLWWTDPDFLGEGGTPFIQFVNLGLYAASAVVTIWLANSLSPAAKLIGQAEGRPDSKTSVVVDLWARRRATVRLANRVVRLLREGLRPNSVAAYGFALACVVLATFIRFAAGWFGDDILPFASYYPAILIAALIGGL